MMRGVVVVAAAGMVVAGVTTGCYPMQESGPPPLRPEAESVQGTPAAGEDEVAVFLEIVRVRETARAEARRRVPMPEGGRGVVAVVAPTRPDKGREKRRRAEEELVGMALHAVAADRRMSVAELERIYRNGLRQGW